MRTISILIFSAGLAACGHSSSGDNAASGANRVSPVLENGAHLDPSVLRAVGSLLLDTPDLQIPGQLDPMLLCTATLVSPTLAVTAKHCLYDAYGDFYPNYYRIKFVVGDFSAPVEQADVIATFADPSRDGGWFMGLDVAFARLDPPIVDVTPLALADGVFSNDDVGRMFSVVGQGGNQARYAGAQALRATTGDYLHVIFGTEGAWEAWFCSVLLSGFPLSSCQPGGSFFPYADASWNSPLGDILEGRQAMFGGGAGQALFQSGDDGGPAIGKQVNVDGSTTLVVYGVATGIMTTNTDGTMMALVGGEEAQQTLAAAATWDDPCVGYNTLGACVGQVATRCSVVGVEGPRRLVQTDCSLAGLACEPSPSGAVVCGVAGTEPNDPPSPVANPPADMPQSASAILSAVQDAAQPALTSSVK